MSLDVTISAVLLFGSSVGVSGFSSQHDASKCECVSESEIVASMRLVLPQRFTDNQDHDDLAGLKSFL
jgi:hypothetical protein